MIRDEEEAKNLVKDLEDYYRNFKTQCESEELYYNLNFTVEAVEGYPIQHPETARVAIDDAANESEWLAPGSFYVGFTFPGWAIYTLIGIVALLVGFLAFWFGRRTAYSES